MKQPYLFVINCRNGSTYSDFYRLTYADSETSAYVKVRDHVNELYNHSSSFEIIDIRSLTIL